MSRVTHVNPPGLHTSPFYSQGTLVDAGRTLYVGGQNGTDASGGITGGAREQSAQALRNVLAVLAAAGATQEDVVHLRVHLAAEVDLDEAYGAVAEVWGAHATALTVVWVVRLGRPEALVEVDAVAALP
ncbi:RidA family protein [Cellulomonas sp. 179-A 9B4 NHS]|uniref:RidA family protein n=1 Tax=Cellulomonas sp. 179-A 9B4 NHS TaxID=3142379 RepID=UPI0039A1BF14